MRSVVVVLPASMWAMIPMLRYRSSGYSRLDISVHLLRTFAVGPDPGEGSGRLRRQGARALGRHGARAARGPRQQCSMLAGRDPLRTDPAVGSRLRHAPRPAPMATSEPLGRAAVDGPSAQGACWCDE